MSKQQELQTSARKSIEYSVIGSAQSLEWKKKWSTYDNVAFCCRRVHSPGLRAIRETSGFGQVEVNGVEYFGKEGLHWGRFGKVPVTCQIACMLDNIGATKVLEIIKKYAYPAPFFLLPNIAI